MRGLVETRPMVVTAHSGRKSGPYTGQERTE